MEHKRLVDKEIYVPPIAETEDRPSNEAEERENAVTSRLMCKLPIKIIQSPRRGHCGTDEPQVPFESLEGSNSDFRQCMRGEIGVSAVA